MELNSISASLQSPTVQKSGLKCLTAFLPDYKMIKITMRKEAIIVSIGEAKTEETKANRIAKAIEKLTDH